MTCGALQSRCRCGSCEPQSRCRCGRGEPSPGADVSAASPVPVQMWQGWAQSRCRCGRGETSPGADSAGGEPSPGADSDVAAVGPVPAQMWQGWAQFGVTVARRSAQVHARRSARQEGRARRAAWAAEHIHRPSTGNAPRALPPQRCGAHARRDATSTGRNANAPQAAGVSGTRAPSPVSTEHASGSAPAHWPSSLGRHH